MLGPGEQVHRLYRLGAVALLLQPGGVPGGGGRVAADVHHPAGRHLHHRLQGGFVAALAGRVQDHHVRVQALVGQLGGGLTGIGTQKAALGGGFRAHPGGVGLGAVHRLLHDLHADQLAALVRHGQTDGAHAAVEIQQQLAGGQLGQLGGGAVELLCRQGVHLVEGQRPQPHRHPAQGVLDKPGAVEGQGLAAQDHIGVLGVDVQQHRLNGGELGPQLGHQLIAVGQAGAGADQTDHDLPTVGSPAQKQMPNQALAGLLVVGRDAVPCQKIAYRLGDLVQDGGLELAVRAGDNAMGAPGIEADAGGTVRAPPHRELYLVAVAVHLRRGQGGQHRQLQPADAAEGILHILPLGPQLGAVVQVAQTAPAAAARRRAVHRDAVRRGGQQLVQDAVGIAAAVLDDADLGLVSRSGAGDEDRLPLRRVGHAAAIAGQALDAQGEELIFM